MNTAAASFSWGDWEDVQIKLGLLEKRGTPRLRYNDCNVGEFNELLLGDEGRVMNKHALMCHSLLVIRP